MGVSLPRLRAKARVAWARGPVRAVQIDGQADDEPADAVPARNSRRSRASAENLLRDSVVSPEAMVWVTSERARPSVLVPTSSPIRRAPAGRARAKASRPGCRLGARCPPPRRSCRAHDPCCGSTPGRILRCSRRSSKCSTVVGMKDEKSRCRRRHRRRGSATHRRAPFSVKELERMPDTSMGVAEKAKPDPAPSPAAAPRPGAPTSSFGPIRRRPSSRRCCCSPCSRCSPRWCCRCSAARRRYGRSPSSSSRRRCSPATATRTC